MSETAISDVTSTDKPVQDHDDVKFPPFPDPTDNDFEDDIPQEERDYYKTKFPDLNLIKSNRLHCTSCDRHLGCAAKNEGRMRSHPMLRTLVCHTCHTFYNSGEFEKGDDGSELYCRWCGQGGQVYCCSNCPHVFCAKCIKRNLGISKIKEIENTDDWKCFKCNNNCLWEIRATCWALMRYCDLKNKITYHTADPTLKEAYQKDCAIDYSECCKNKVRQRSVVKKEKSDAKKKDSDTSREAKKAAAAVISKIPPTIQVKKFASINLEETSKPEKKPEKRPAKRPASPRNKTTILKNPLPVQGSFLFSTPSSVTLPMKKMRKTVPNIINPVIFQNNGPRANVNTYARIRPKAPILPMILNNQYNGFNNPQMFNNMMVNDNINLSLESLTQGLDMATVASMTNENNQDDLVCTPDFPLEPLCEVTEDNTDDDVQCITPAPVSAPKIANPPPLVPRLSNPLPDLSPENVIQMTENDVTVNTVTGGLKFRVDPQTLSSNKMYRLPDGRIFAINANPNMPGGYSATIVALTDNAAKTQAKGATYAAKLSAVPTPAPPPLSKTSRNSNTRSTPNPTLKSNSSKKKQSKTSDTPSRECDLHVPVEWYRYNLIDALDSLEYSVARLQTLKKDATTMFLRTRTLTEMKHLHRSLERLLNTSSTRFNEIRENLNKGMKQYIQKKASTTSSNVSDNDDDDDDDVEILNDLVNDDPIFIDENSADTIDTIEQQEVDLTGRASSERNAISEKSFEQINNSNKDPLAPSVILDERNGDIVSNVVVSDDSLVNETIREEEKGSEQNVEKQDNMVNYNEQKGVDQHSENNEKQSDNDEKKSETDEKQESDINGTKEIADKKDDDCEQGKLNETKTDDTEQDDEIDEPIKDVEMTENVKVKEVSNDQLQDIEMSEEKTQDNDISDEMIESLLKDDNGGDVEGQIDSLDSVEESEKT